MVACEIKDAGLWVHRFLKAIEEQDQLLRVVFMYGESIDATYSIIKHYSRISKHAVEIYAEPHLPPDERFGWTLARIKREFQTLFLEGDDEHFLLCDSDIVKLPTDLITKLIQDEVDVVAPYIWTEMRRSPKFYDAYVWRLGGHKFHPYDPPGAGGDELFEVDSVGSCYLVSRKAMKDGIYYNPFPHIQFCNGLRDKGYSIWGDPRLNIVHADLEKYGIKHYAPPIPLSIVDFVNSELNPVVDAQVLREEAYTHVHDYEAWISENEPSDEAWIKRFVEGRPLITASYKVFNEAEYLRYSLESVYPYVDRIDIVEGAVAKNMHCSNLDGSSIDDTIQIMKDFPDPDGKIRMVHGKWRSKEHVQRKLLELCESRWMMFIDGDELYQPQDMVGIRDFCLSHLDGKIVYALPKTTLNFWHDWRHVAYSLDAVSPWCQSTAMHPLLIWRDVQGLNFKFFHTYPFDGLGRSLAIDPYYEDKRVILEDLVLYHYGHAKSALNMVNKLLYFEKRDVTRGLPKPSDMWLSGVMPPDFVIKEYDGEHPKVLKAHPLYGKSLIKVIEKKPVYRFERLEESV